MSNDFDWKVVFDLAVKGGPKSTEEINAVRDALDKARESGDLTQKSYDGLNKGLNKASRAMDETGRTAGVAAATVGKHGAAQEESSKKVSKNTDSLNSQRYALYEMAAAYGVVSAAVLKMGGSVVSAFTEMESGMTKVERTSGLYGDAFGPLEKDLLSLSRQIPVTSADLQDLASRGAQLGIASDQIDAFTETIAKFVATSDTVDANAAAEAFGRLSNLTGVDDWEALGSAVARVGVIGAATDAQILKTTQELAPFGNAAGMSAAEIIGLAGAMASLGVPPERARSAISSLVSVVDNAVSGLNDKLPAYASLIGKTTDETAKLWKTDPTQFIYNMTEALGTSEDLTGALSGLGLTEKRVTSVFTALANNSQSATGSVSELSKQVRESTEAFGERLELDRQFAPIADDLASKWILLQNAAMELGYQIGTVLAPAMKGFVNVLTEVLHGVTDFVSSPVGGFITRLASAISIVIGVYAGLRSAIALSTAALMAFSTAQGAVAGSGISGALSGLIGMLKGTERGAHRATGAVFSLRTALKALGAATVIGAVLQYVTEWIFNAGSAAQQTGGVLIWLSDVISAAFNKIAQFVSGISSTLGVVTQAFGVMASGSSGSGLGAMGKDLQKWGKSLSAAESNLGGFNAQLGDMPPYLDDASDGVDNLSGGMGGLGDSAAAAAQEIRTLKDYAGDLASVWQRAFEIRFSSGQAGDKITKTFQDLRDAAAASEQKVRDLRLQIQSLKGDLSGLQADISKQTYFLSIATEYGDSKRQEQIQANLAKLQAELASKQNDLAKSQNELTKEQADNSKTLVGNSAAAIKNRESILGLVQSYQSQLEALASSGMSQAELAVQTERLRQDFIRQATQLGFNRGELDKYTRAFDDVRVAINNVPRNVTVTANVNPAIQALNEFVAKAKQAGTNAKNNFNSGLSGIGSNIPRTIQGSQVNMPPPTPWKSWSDFARGSGVLFKAGAGGLNAADRTALSTLLRPGFAEGGYTGAGGKYDPAGVVHKGEYVIPKKHVNQSTGLPYADAMGKLQRGSKGSSYANGGHVRPSSGDASVVALTAGTIQAIAQAVQPHLVLDGKLVGEAAGRSYQTSTQLGSA